MRIVHINQNQALKCVKSGGTVMTAMTFESLITSFSKTVLTAEDQKKNAEAIFNLKRKGFWYRATQVITIISGIIFFSAPIFFNFKNEMSILLWAILMTLMSSGLSFLIFSKCYNNRQQKLKGIIERCKSLIEDFEEWEGKYFEPCLNNSFSMEVQIKVFGEVVFESEVQGPISPADQEAAGKVVVAKFEDLNKRLLKIEDDLWNFEPAN